MYPVSVVFITLVPTKSWSNRDPGVYLGFVDSFLVFYINQIPETVSQLMSYLRQ